MKKTDKRLNKIYQGLIYALPVVVFFSFWPWINLGYNDTMNFELSLPLIWLVVFDVFSFVLIIKKKAWKWALDKWPWLLFPIFLTISLAWSHDFLRGFLIIGVLWTLYFAVFAFVSLKDEISDKAFLRNWCKVLFGITLFVCGWCLVQSIMDVVGVEQRCTLLCDGCLYKIFGFPHPNGFAAEPQFMGNLLLMPILLTLYLWMKDALFAKKWLILLFFIFTATLFLTLSRGAIYAFFVALLFFTVVWVIKTKKWRVLVAWPVVGLALFVTLNVQGIFAEVSKTDDTYISGVSKAVNQLTLGIIDLGGSQVKKENGESQPSDTNNNGENQSSEAANNTDSNEESEQSMFDGYVEVSTDVRLSAWRGALKTWSRTPKTILFGVGMGSGLISMYEDGTISSSHEIINNQYVSILLESGIIGAGLMVLSMVLVYRAIRKKHNNVLIFTLLIAYAVSLCFFSGLPNALHVYLLPAILAVLLCQPTKNPLDK